MRIGYALVSTLEQNLDLQLDALKTAQCKRIYEEHASGRNPERPETGELPQGVAARRCARRVAIGPAGPQSARLGANRNSVR